MGVANEGFLGHRRPAENTTYRASFYAKAAAGFSGALDLSLESNDGATIHAQAEVTDIGPDWQKYTVKCWTTAALTPSAAEPPRPLRSPSPARSGSTSSPSSRRPSTTG